MRRENRERDPGEPRRRALLIASDQYEAPELSGLRSPAHDVEALATALSDPRIGAFEVARVFNRPAHQVNAAIEDLFCEKRPSDVLLLYVSCHGVKDDAGRLYFATTNTRISRLGSSAVASTFVSEQMSLSMSRNIILLLDCCYSGAFVEGMVRRGGGNVGITERLSGSGRAILSSSSALEYAFELDERHMTKEVSLADAGRELGGRPSVFTGALIEGLVTGDADENRDGLISVDELYDYAYTKVTSAHPNQNPTKFSNVSGELIVAYSPKTAQPPTLPEEVVSAADHPLQSVRLAAVGTLAGLACAGSEIGRLAYERLVAMVNDDSRSVAAKARDAVSEIDAGRPTPYRPAPDLQAPWQLPGGQSPPAASPFAGGPSQQPWRPVPPPPIPHQIEPILPRPPTRDPGEGLRGLSVLAYFLPLFTSLALVPSKSLNVRYHAVHCALIDGLTSVYLIAAVIPIAVYESVRYGTDEIPPGDLAMNLFIASLFALPWGLRAYCLVQLARKGTARVTLLGTLAHRIVGRNAVPR